MKAHRTGELSCVDKTHNLVAMPIHDPASLEIVRRKLDADFVASQNLDPVLAHLAADIGQDFIPRIIQLDAKERVGQVLYHRALQF